MSLTTGGRKDTPHKLLQREMGLVTGNIQSYKLENTKEGTGLF
jgi:hypothetical protein